METIKIRALLNSSNLYSIVAPNIGVRGIMSKSIIVITKLWERHN